MRARPRDAEDVRPPAFSASFKSARGVQGGNQSENQRGASGNEQGEEQRAGIHGDAGRTISRRLPPSARCWAGPRPTS